MSWLGDVFNFEQFNAKEMLNKIGKDPERIFIGAADPFASKVWGKILNKDYEPVVDQWGGASADTYDKARAQGINTGPGATMHGVARTIAGMYAGGAASNAMGGASSAGGGSGLLNSGTTAAEGMNGGTGLLSSSVGEGLQAGQGLNMRFAGAGSNAAGSGTSMAGLLESAKPYMSAANNGLSVANKMKEMNKQEQIPVGPMQPMGGGAGPQGLATLASQMDQQAASRLEQDQIRRQLQQGLINRIGGR